MFKFNFSEEQPRGEKRKHEDNSESGQSLTWFDSKEHFLDETHLESLSDDAQISTFPCAGTDLVLNILDSAAVGEKFKGEKSGPLKVADSSHSDLIPAVYEGGMKIWECSGDLVEYLGKKSRDDLDLSGKRVLEVGCGAGLPGN